jgi:hypothetical protein
MVTVHFEDLENFIITSTASRGCHDAPALAVVEKAHELNERTARTWSNPNIRNHAHPHCSPPPF